MKKQFEEILKEHGIYGEDVEEVLNAVSDMLEIMACKIEIEEPYATVSIRELKTLHIKCLI